MHHAFRIWHVQATRAYRGEALGDARAMHGLRACESESFAARFRVASCGRGGVERPWLGQVWIFENLVQNLPARESAKNLGKFACPSRPPVAPDP